jgi:hypothetical protein
VVLGFDGAGVSAAPGNTDLTPSCYRPRQTPVPDVVALPATAQNDASCALLLAISLCKTNPMSGQCISSISSSVTTTINRPRPSRFSQRPAARVPFVPRPNRTLVEFGHANSVVRGATGVAIEMQSDPRIIPVGLPRQP